MSDEPPPPGEEQIFSTPYPGIQMPQRMMSDNPLWRRPDSTAKTLHVFRTVRDHTLSYLRVLLETQLGGAISIDHDGDEIIHLEWESCVTQYVTWSDSFGMIGPGLTLSVNKKPFVMIQIGAAEVTMDVYGMIPTTWFVEKFVPSTERTGYVLTQRNYFMTHEALQSFGDPDFVRTVVPDARLWYQVTFPCLEFALQRLIQRNAR